MDRLASQAVGLYFGAFILALIWWDVEAKTSQYLLSESTYRAITAVQELTQNNKLQKALRGLKKIRSKVRGNLYESAVVYQNLGYVYHMLGQHEQAIESFKKSLETNTLPDNVAHTVRYNLAQLLIANKQYQQGLNYLEGWLKQELKPSSEALFLAAIAYHSKGQCRQAIVYVTKAIAQQPDPQEAWYQLLLSCYYKISQYKKAAQTLEILVKRFPQKHVYWVQLASVYQHLKWNRKALSTLELAYRLDILREAEILMLANMYMYYKMPYQAAHILNTEINRGRIEKSLQNWVMLSDNLYLAQEQEQSIGPLRRAAELSQDGELYYRLGQILFDLEYWKDALVAFESAIKKAGLKYPGMAHLLLGISGYRAGDVVRSQAAFETAEAYQNSKQQAQWWLNTLKRDVED